MNVTMFANDWYANMINQTLNAHSKASPDALVLADAVMVAGAFIAEALDNSIQGRRDDASVCDQLGSMAGVIEQLGETLAAREQ